MFLLPMYASASRKTSSTASAHRFLLLIVAMALTLALLPGARALGQAATDPPATSDPVVEAELPAGVEGATVDPDAALTTGDPAAATPPVTESEPLITEAEPLIVAPPVVDPPVETPPPVDPPPGPVEPPPVEEPPVATTPEVAPPAAPTTEPPAHAPTTEPPAAGVDNEVVVTPVKGPDRPNAAGPRGPRPDVDVDVVPGTKVSALSGPAIGAGATARAASATGGVDAPAAAQALPTFRPDSPDLPGDAQVAATATAAAVAAPRPPLGEVRARVLDLTPAEAFVAGAGSQSLLPAGSADAIPTLDRPTTAVPTIAGVDGGAVAARREELRPTVGLGALAGYFARSSSDAGAGATLLDALASRIVPGGGGATIPTLLLVFTAALALALSLPRAPRRIGRVIDADWATLDGFRTSPARPG